MGSSTSRCTLICSLNRQPRPSIPALWAHRWDESQPANDRAEPWFQHGISTSTPCALATVPSREHGVAIPLAARSASRFRRQAGDASAHASHKASTIERHTAHRTVQSRRGLAWCGGSTSLAAALPKAWQADQPPIAFHASRFQHGRTNCRYNALACRDGEHACTAARARRGRMFGSRLGTRLMGALPRA